MTGVVIIWAIVIISANSFIYNIKESNKEIKEIEELEKKEKLSEEDLENYNSLKREKIFLMTMLISHILIASVFTFRLLTGLRLSEILFK